MPLRDHFRPPLDDVHSWDELHGLWPGAIVYQLTRVLPQCYYAAPNIHLGYLYESDVGTIQIHQQTLDHSEYSTDDGGVGLATFAQPVPTLTLEPKLTDEDTYEVLIYDNRRKRRLVAAIEIVSPANKDRPETRMKIVNKVESLLKNNICVSIVDVVSTMNFNLYAELLESVEGVDPALGDEPPPMYAVTLRSRNEGHRKLLDNWYYSLALGQPLPTLPIWLNEKQAVSLDLEACYEESCRTLRIR